MNYRTAEIPTLAEQPRILRVLADALEEFLRAEDWEAAISRVLANLGQVARVSRVCVFANRKDEDGRLVSVLRYEWVADGIASRLDGPADSPAVQGYPWREGVFHRWADLFSRGEIIYGNVKDFPPDEAEALQSHGLVSTLAVPVFVRGEWWGFIGFDECHRERTWTPTEVDALRAAANMFAAALERHIMQEEVERHARALAQVGQILEALNATPDVERAFPHIVEGLRSLTNCDRVSIVLLENGNRWFRLIVLDQPRPELAQGIRMPLATTSAAADILAGRPHLTPDLSRELGTPAERMLYEAGHRCRVNVPLRVEGKVLGSLNLTWPVVHGYRDEDIALLQQVADALALAIERTHYLRAEERRRKVAEALHKASLVLNSELKLEQVLERILTAAAEVIPYDSATVFLHKGDHLRVAAMRGFPNPEKAKMQLYPVNNPLFVEIERTRRPIYLEDAQADPRFENWNTPYEIRGWMGIPLIAWGQLLGFLTLDSAQPGAYGEEEVRIAAAFAQQAAIALHNAQLYQAVVSANEELEKALEVRTKIVRTVYHELRTPLTLLVASAELLEVTAGDALPDKARERVRIIVQQARHVSYMLEQFLSLERVSSIQMALRSVDVTTWLQEVHRAWEPVFARDGQLLHLEVAPDVGEVQGHPEFLRRVVDNLLDNSRKHSPAGATTTIRAWREGKTVYVSVADQGAGVPPEALPRLFERFYQVDRQDIYPTGGLGLGLALAKEIVERHGGRIWAECEGEGKGLTVTFTLRAASNT